MNRHHLYSACKNHSKVHSLLISFKSMILIISLFGLFLTTSLIEGSTTCKYTSKAPTSANSESLCTGGSSTTCCTPYTENYLTVVSRTQSATASYECSVMLQDYFCAGCLEGNQGYFAVIDNPNIPFQYVTPCKAHCEKMKETCTGTFVSAQALLNLNCNALPTTNCWNGA